MVLTSHIQEEGGRGRRGRAGEGGGGLGTQKLISVLVFEDV